MSFLNLGKSFLPARKAWKDLTSKLQTKLHKLQRYRAIKKPRNQLNATRKGGLLPSLSLQPRRSRRKGTLHYHRCHRRAAPVYVDELFKEAVPKVAEDDLRPPPAAAAARKGAIAKKEGQARKKLKVVDQPAAVPGPSKENGKGAGKTSVADDMWESLALASPLMHGIDERAEEFIARFRAEMEMQETLARGL